MAVSSFPGHPSFVTTLTFYADYRTEGDTGKAAPLRRTTAGGRRSFNAPTVLGGPPGHSVQSA